MDEKQTPAKVIVYRRWKIGPGQEGTAEVGILELDITAWELTRVHGWKRRLMEHIEHVIRMGKPEAVNVLAQPIKGCHVAVTLQLEKQELGRRKPITRGGRPIPDKPIRVRTARRIRAQR